MSKSHLGVPTSLNELEFLPTPNVCIQTPTQSNSLDKKTNKKVDSANNANSSELTASSGLSASTRLAVSKPSLNDDLSTSFQAAMLSTIHKNKVIIRCCPESSDFSSYSVYITGSNQTLKTPERSTKNPKKEEISLRSYQTNVVKLKQSILNSSEEKVYIYLPTNTKPQKIGKIKRSQGRFIETKLYDAQGNATYVIEDDKLSQGAKNSSGVFSWLTCSTNKSTKTQGKINLRNIKTGKVDPLGHYRLMEVKSRGHDKSFHTFRYELEFPEELLEETRVLISSSLISEVGKNVFCKYEYM